MRMFGTRFEAVCFCDLFWLVFWAVLRNISLTLRRLALYGWTKPSITRRKPPTTHRLLRHLPLMTAETCISWTWTHGHRIVGRLLCMSLFCAQYLLNAGLAQRFLHTRPLWIYPCGIYNTICDRKDGRVLPKYSTLRQHVYLTPAENTNTWAGRFAETSWQTVVGFR